MDTLRPPQAVCRFDRHVHGASAPRTEVINTATTSHRYFWGVRILKVYSLSKFQLYNTVLPPHYTLDSQTSFILYLKVCSLFPASPQVPTSPPGQPRLYSVSMSLTLARFLL